MTILTHELTFRILDPKTQAMLGELKLDVTGALAGAEEGKDLPMPSDFSAAVFACNCDTEEALFVRINAALNRFFVNGYQPDTFTKPFRLVSTYRRLQVPNPSTGKIAVQVEYPVQTEDGRLGFRVAFAKRESASNSSTWVTAREQSVTKAANDEADLVVKAMQLP